MFYKKPHNESAEAIKWLKLNNMLVNPKKFQVLLLSRNGQLDSGTISNINNNNIKSSNWVKLLGIKIDNKLSFELHVSDLWKSILKQLNVLLR